MNEHSGISHFESIAAELRRIGLDMHELSGLAGSEDGLDAFLSHLRSLPPGATWSAVFPEMSDDGRADAGSPTRALGPFDYAEPPRGPAVFASLETEQPEATGAAALNYVRSLGLPIYGSGVVLDRGSPHLYVVLARDAVEDDVYAVVEALRIQPGILNSYPVRPDVEDDDRN